MNRRTILAAIIPAILALFFGVRRSWGKASPKAAALAHNGIISKKRTPHLVGCKVYVNGEQVKHAISVNTRKGYVLAWNQKPTADPMTWTKSRIYGYIDIDPSDCYIVRPGLVGDERGSMHGDEPHNYHGRLYWTSPACKCGMVACDECRPRYLEEHPAECERDLEFLKDRGVA